MSPPSNLRLIYTAPQTPDTGHSIASVTLDGSTVNLVAVCQTQLSIDHPPGQTLRFVQAPGSPDSTDQSVSVVLPNEEGEFNLSVVAEPSGEAAEIKVITKRQGSKPDPPLSARF